MAAGFELGDLLREAAMGKFPSPAESVAIVPKAEGAVGAVVAFGGYNVVACDLPAAEILAQLPPNDLGAPINAAFICWLAGRLRAQAGNHLLVLAARGTSATPKTPLQLRADLNQHPRLERAQRHRTDVRVYSDAAGHAVITIGRGLAGRFEIGVEIEPGVRNRGLGRELIRAATALVPSGVPLFAQVAIGNVASTRAFLQAGYRPICAEVLFVPHTSTTSQGGG